jgi:hypothetical protein
LKVILKRRINMKNMTKTVKNVAKFAVGAMYLSGMLIGSLMTAMGAMKMAVDLGEECFPAKKEENNETGSI